MRIPRRLDLLSDPVVGDVSNLSGTLRVPLVRRVLPPAVQVFQALVDVGATKTKISLDKAQVVLGAHSGGAFTVNSMLKAATAEAGGKEVKGLSTAGARIAEVAIFEAAIDKGRWRTVWAWARSHLDRLAVVADSQADVPQKASAIRGAPKLRAYYGSSYVKPHQELAAAIADWFDQPFAPNGKATGRTNRAALGAYVDDVAALFRVIRVPGVGHEEIVRGRALADTGAADAGSVTDALKALANPKAGPIPGLGTVLTPKPKKAVRRKVKPAAATPTRPTNAGAGASPAPRSLTKRTTDVNISWGSNAKRDAVADSSLAILMDVVRAAGLSKATITSTARSATDQARAMYQNLIGQGVTKQKELYGRAGDKVIDVFVALRDEGKSAQEIKDGMRDAILAIGPSAVSRHCGDPKLVNVFDVGPNSLGDDAAKEAFNAAAGAEVGRRVSKYIPYPKDPGNHFEIKPSGGAAPAPANAAPKAGPPAPEPAPTAVPAAPSPEPANAPALKRSAPSATGGATTTRGAGWKASDATSSYALTTDERTALDAQTAEERAADRNELRAEAKRLKKLRKAEKAGTLTEADTKELADLQALEARVKAAAKLAFQKQDAEEVLDAAGLTVTGWYSNIVKGSFLGIPLRVHQELADRLDRAQSALVGDAKINPDGQSAAELGKTLKMYKSSSDLRAPKAATDGTQLSLHTFGLAVDLNYAGNPFVGHKKPAKDKRTDVTMAARTPRMIERAMWLVNGKAFDVEAADAVPRRSKDVGAAWDAHREASDALVTYLALAADTESQAFADRVKACGEPKGVKWAQPKTGAWWNDVAWWKKRVTDDMALANTYDFSEKGHHGYAETTGYMDLSKEMVVSLVDAGLTWGGQYGGAKDMMHFDWRSGGDDAKVDRARAGDEPNH